MKTILRFEFDNQLFYPAYTGPRNITLENPPHVPQSGDPLNFKISDFFENKRVIRAFNDLEDGNVLYARRVLTRYGRDTVEVIVVVYEEKVFKTHFLHQLADSIH